MKVRPLRSLLWNKKGITPVLSNLLLTLIAVAAMSIAATATYVISDNLHEYMGERFIIEDVWFKNETGGEVMIYVRNTGKVSIEIASVYLNNTPQPLTPVPLKVGKHDWLNITYSWNPGSVYHLNVMTERGTRVDEYYKAPST